MPKVRSHLRKGKNRIKINMHVPNYGYTVIERRRFMLSQHVKKTTAWILCLFLSASLCTAPISAEETEGIQETETDWTDEGMLFGEEQNADLDSTEPESMAESWEPDETVPVAEENNSALTEEEPASSEEFILPDDMAGDAEVSGLEETSDIAPEAEVDPESMEEMQDPPALEETMLPDPDPEIPEDGTGGTDLLTEGTEDDGGETADDVNSVEETESIEDPSEIAENSENPAEEAGQGENTAESVEDSENPAEESEQGENTAGEAEAEWFEAIEEETVVPVWEETGEDLLSAYLEGLLLEQIPGEADHDSLLRMNAALELNAGSAQLYSILEMRAAAVAAGEEVSTIVSLVPEEDLAVNTSFTAGSKAEAQAGAKALYLEQVDYPTVIRVLLATHPYELYWYDKTVGTGIGYKYSISSAGGVYTARVVNVEYKFSVAAEYAGAGAFETDPSFGETIQSAVRNAVAIADSFSNLPDYERLVAYREKICELTSYNSVAAVDSNVPYGNPWQLIWVFDEDEETKVVCEGYAKAFQYLCDLSGFTEIECISVSGTLNGGRHMWNIVSMPNGRNYLVDETNCDEGTVGAGDGLFFPVPSAGSFEEGYVFETGSSRVTYCYDADTLALYGTEDLELDDETYSLEAMNAAALEIVSQPENISALAGEQVSLTVVAAGTDLSYRWQYSKNNGSTWIDCKTVGSVASFSFTLSTAMDGRLYRCIVSDGMGNTVISESAAVSVAVPLSILAQPESFSGAAGDTVTLHVEVAGSDLSYQWQYSVNQGSTWKNCSSGTYATDTFSFVMKDTLNGRWYRCRVSDASGSIYSEAALIEIASADSVRIVSGPEDVSAPVGETAVLHVEATGSGLTYQWQYSKNNGSTWTNCTSAGSKTDTFSFKLTAGLNGRLYRCVVTGVNGFVNSNSASINVVTAEVTVITLQPEDVSGYAGDTVTLHVEATGSNLTYQWRYSVNEGASWKNCGSGGYNTDTFSFALKSTLSGRWYQCVVTGSDGAHNSDVSVVTVLEDTAFEILTQPESVTGAVGDTVVLHVEASGNGLTYQWQYTTNGSTWRNCGSGTYNTDTLTFALKESFSGRQYRCVVTSGSQSIPSEAATILVGEPLEITSQPEDISGRAGDTVSLHLEVSGTVLAYQWQYSVNNGDTWKNCKSGTYNTDTFSFTLSDTLAGRLYRCQVTDFTGAKISSDVAVVNVLSNYVIDHVIYELIEDVMTVTGYEGDYASYIVQEEVAGYTVTVIGASAFEGNTNLETIDLPDTIEVIGRRAFADCTSLKSMN